MELPRSQRLLVLGKNHFQLVRGHYLFRGKEPTPLEKTAYVFFIFHELGNPVSQPAGFRIRHPPFVPCRRTFGLFLEVPRKLRKGRGLVAHTCPLASYSNPGQWSSSLYLPLRILSLAQTFFEVDTLQTIQLPRLSLVGADRKEGLLLPYGLHGRISCFLTLGT